MSTSPAFEWLAAELARTTTLSPLQARGTVRHMIADAGFDPRNLRKQQLVVLLERQLNAELDRRGVAHTPTFGPDLASLLRRTPLDETHVADRPEDVFARLGRA